MTLEDARLIAIKALAYLASDTDRLGRFLAATGISPEEIRAKAEDLNLLAGILDFLLSDEAMVIEFCQTLDLPPEAPAQARIQLPGYAPPM